MAALKKPRWHGTAWAHRQQAALATSLVIVFAVSPLFVKVQRVTNETEHSAESLKQRVDLATSTRRAAASGADMGAQKDEQK